MEKHIEITEKIKEIILNRMRVYRCAKYNLPAYIRIRTVNDILKIDVYGCSIKAFLIEDNIIIKSYKKAIGPQSAKRIKNDIKDILKNLLNENKDLDITIQVIDFNKLANYLKYYILTNFEIDNIDNHTITNIINSMPNKLLKAYEKSYEYEKGNIIGYYFNTELSEIFKFHNNINEFENYILNNIKKLDRNSFLELLEHTEELMKITKKDLKRSVIDCFLNQTLTAYDKEETMYVVYQDKVISSI